MVASEEGHVDIVKLLLQNNARVDVFDEVSIHITYTKETVVYRQVMKGLSGPKGNLYSFVKPQSLLKDVHLTQVLLGQYHVQLLVANIRGFHWKTLALGPKI